MPTTANSFESTQTSNVLLDRRRSTNGLSYSKTTSNWNFHTVDRKFQLLVVLEYVIHLNAFELSSNPYEQMRG